MNVGHFTHVNNRNFFFFTLQMSPRTKLHAFFDVTKHLVNVGRFLFKTNSGSYGFNIAREVKKTDLCQRPVGPCSTRTVSFYYR